MGTTAIFTAELLGDGHLPIPEKLIKVLSLKKGEKIKAVIEAEKFDKDGFFAVLPHHPLRYVKGRIKH